MSTLDNIEFHSEDIDFQLPNPDIVRMWIHDTIREEGSTLDNLNFIFCSDEYLYQLNVEYLQHDTYTDVITFPYSDDSVEGDIFISVERTRDNAQDFGVSPMHELHRVIIHGVLHLIGYDDHSDEDEAAMRAKENHYLAKYPLPL